MNGRIVIDDAAADPMTAGERAALERAIERSLEQADAGELIEADEVLAEARAAPVTIGSTRPEL